MEHTQRSRDGVAARCRAPAVLAAALVANARGVDAAVRALRARAVGALAENMPSDEAALLCD